MKYLWILFSLSIFAQTVTPINGLRLESLTATPDGGILVEWYADPGDTTVHGANEYWFITWSQDEHFVDAPYLRIPAWLDADTLNLSHKIPPAGNGTWFVKIAFGWSINQLFDITEHGSNTGWTPYAAVVVNTSYRLPELILPTEQPYTGNDLLLRWIDSENIPTYELQYSDTQDFYSFQTISLLQSENGVRRLDLSGIPEGIIYFRFRGTTNAGVTTAWSWAIMYYKPDRTYLYILPWVASNDSVHTFVNFNILNDAATTDVKVGILPPKNGTFQPSIWWQTLTAYRDSIFLEDAADLFPFDVQGRPMLFESDEPVSVNIYYDVSMGTVPVQTPFLLPEGSAENWLIPSIRRDDQHIPSLVVCNASDAQYAVLDWRLDYIQDGVYEFETGGLSVAPFENSIINIKAPGKWVGYIKITNRTDTNVSVLYSNRNELGDGAVIYGFQPALQIK